jgi:hypothetical protein
MAFATQNCRAERIPCRHIPLNVEGYTIETHYHLGTQEELEVDVASWIRETKRLEGESARQQQESRAPKPSYSAAVAGGRN